VEDDAGLAYNAIFVEKHTPAPVFRQAYDFVDEAPAVGVDFRRDSLHNLFTRQSERAHKHNKIICRRSGPWHSRFNQEEEFT
jgi:hypothetical protein